MVAQFTRGPRLAMRRSVMRHIARCHGETGRNVAREPTCHSVLVPMQPAQGLLESDGTRTGAPLCI